MTKKLIFYFKNWLFDYRKKRAIKKAQELANEQRMKFLVLNFNGKPVVVSMQHIKKLIRTKRIKGSAEYYRDMALYTAMPQNIHQTH